MRPMAKKYENMSEKGYNSFWFGPHFGTPKSHFFSMWVPRGRFGVSAENACVHNPARFPPLCVRSRFGAHFLDLGCPRGSILGPFWALRTLRIVWYLLCILHIATSRSDFERTPAETKKKRLRATGFFAVLGLLGPPEKLRGTPGGPKIAPLGRRRAKMGGPKNGSEKRAYLGGEAGSLGG